MGLYNYGVKGMKWGIRKKRYDYQDKRFHAEKTLVKTKKMGKRYLFDSNDETSKLIFWGGWV